MVGADIFVPLPPACARTVRELRFFETAAPNADALVDPAP
jgi:hypothetical protein